MMTTIQERDLHGLKALVTGATAGLGRAIAVQLARDGADVTVHGRDAARGAQTLEEIELQGGTARFVAADLADATSIARFAKDVRVNAVAPGPIYTRPEARELFHSLGATTAMKRAADPPEIAEVVAFLASPRASYMTGAIVAVDGGRTAI
jgi:NAD(P)-dependent dehydrogenase (short-subunit alcohol dehydrogenase family)